MDDCYIERISHIGELPKAFCQQAVDRPLRLARSETLRKFKLSGSVRRHEGNAEQLLESGVGRNVLATVRWALGADDVA
jgi:hypothetical protein